MVAELDAKLTEEIQQGISSPDPISYDIQFVSLCDSYLQSAKSFQEKTTFLQYLLSARTCCPLTGLLRDCIDNYVDQWIKQMEALQPGTLTAQDLDEVNAVRTRRFDTSVITFLWDKVEDLDTRVRALEDFRRNAETRLGNLEATVQILDIRLKAIEAWRKQVDEQLDTMNKRIAALEAFAADTDLSQAEQTKVLDKFTPVFKFDTDGSDSGPILNPSGYAENCDLGNIGSEPKVWSSADLAQWLSNEGNSRDSSYRHLAPLGWREQSHNGLALNQEAVARHKGVFGHVRKLAGEHRYSVKYFMFLAWNETDFPGGEGNHEGDWLCLDLQVAAKFRKAEAGTFDYELLYAIYHHHGDQDVTDEFNKTDDGRPIAYLERGTNELHPKTGGDDFLSGVRSYDGGGLVYDAKGAVRNLNFCDDVDCQLIRNYRGEWGAYHVDNWKDVPWIGHTVTSPKGPPWQDKMWNRSFSKNPDDPRAS